MRKRITAAVAAAMLAGSQIPAMTPTFAQEQVSRQVSSQELIDLYLSKVTVNADGTKTKTVFKTVDDINNTNYTTVLASESVYRSQSVQTQTDIANALSQAQAPTYETLLARAKAIDTEQQANAFIKQYIPVSTTDQINDSNVDTILNSESAYNGLAQAVKDSVNTKLSGGYSAFLNKAKAVDTDRKANAFISQYLPVKTTAEVTSANAQTIINSESEYNKLSQEVKDSVNAKITGGYTALLNQAKTVQDQEQANSFVSQYVPVKTSAEVNSTNAQTIMNGETTYNGYSDSVKALINAQLTDSYDTLLAAAKNVQTAQTQTTALRSVRLYSAKKTVSTTASTEASAATTASTTATTASTESSTEEKTVSTTTADASATDTTSEKTESTSDDTTTEEKTSTTTDSSSTSDTTASKAASLPTATSTTTKKKTSTVTAFVETYLTDAQGNIYTEATTENYRTIIGGVSAWNSMKTVQKARVNSIVSKATGKTYQSLLQEAQKIQTKVMNKETNTAAATGSTFYRLLCTAAGAVFSWLLLRKPKKH